MPRLSIVVPVYYNELNIPSFYQRVSLLAKPGLEFEFIFVDDGSGDNTLEVLKAYRDSDPRINIVKLSRNFGSHVAVLAGLSLATGDCAAVISADLQDPPELLLDMYEDWLRGNEVVLAVRQDREESTLQVFTSNLYYRIMQTFAIRDMPSGGFDFFLADRKVIDIITKIREKNTTIMGQILWVGFKRTIHPYTRQQRKVGKSRWTFAKKFKLFIDSLTAFSYFPIRFMSMFGLLLFLVSSLYAFFIVFIRLRFGLPVEGWSSLMVVVLLLSGVQLVSLGVIGEYLWRNFDETRKRPLFIIDEVFGDSLRSQWLNQALGD